MKSKINFFVQFLKKPKSVGSIVPSSRSLSDQVVKSIDFSRDLCIFEFGPGDGIFTTKIYSKMTILSKLYIIESNLDFYLRLKAKFENCQNIEVIHDSVENIENICVDRNISSIDYIISGIPYLSLGGRFLKKVLKKSSKLLKGEFILFQYTRRLEPIFKRVFKNVSHTKVVRNIPPAFVYILNNEVSK